MTKIAFVNCLIGSVKNSDNLGKRERERRVRERKRESKKERERERERVRVCGRVC